MSAAKERAAAEAAVAEAAACRRNAAREHKVSFDPLDNPSLGTRWSCQRPCCCRHFSTQRRYTVYGRDTNQVLQAPGL